ncbi:class I tRNA ligase family protein, partial [Candidatus Woesearchaeota archaeon]|nr:class I tRNA ligase family protein [Candidatus Woesearchaeota archaeon]
MELPKRYDPKEAEPRLQKFWLENNTYAFNAEDTERKIFSIDTPPPTVSGKMHMGHAFSNSQQDFIARYKRMQNFNVLQPLGTDDNG